MKVKNLLRDGEAASNKRLVFSVMVLSWVYDDEFASTGLKGPFGENAHHAKVYVSTIWVPIFAIFFAHLLICYKFQTPLHFPVHGKRFVRNVCHCSFLWPGRYLLLFWRAVLLAVRCVASNTSFSSVPSSQKKRQLKQCNVERNRCTREVAVEAEFLCSRKSVEEVSHWDGTHIDDFGYWLSIRRPALY